MLQRKHSIPLRAGRTWQALSPPRLQSQQRKQEGHLADSTGCCGRCVAKSRAAGTAPSAGRQAGRGCYLHGWRLLCTAAEKCPLTIATWPMWSLLVPASFTALRTAAGQQGMGGWPQPQHPSRPQHLPQTGGGVARAQGHGAIHARQLVQGDDQQPACCSTSACKPAGWPGSSAACGPAAAAPPPPLQGVLTAATGSPASETAGSCQR